MVLNIDDPKFIKLVERGISIGELEKKLRPEGGESEEGFLGKNERLLEIIHADWKILEKYNVTHEEIANVLENLIYYSTLPKLKKILKKKRFELNSDFEYMVYKSYGAQFCPWGCRGVGSTEGVIHLKEIDEHKRRYMEMCMIGGEQLQEEIEKDVKGYCMSDEVKKEQKKNPYFATITTILPHMIRKHYFFEGKETIFRVDPKFLIKALKLDK